MKQSFDEKEYPINEYHLVHATSSINEILDSGFILPISKTNTPSYHEANGDEDFIMNKEYAMSIWTSFIYPINSDISNLTNLVLNMKEKFYKMIYIFLDIESLEKDGMLKNSYFCPTWWGSYSDKECYLYNENVNLKTQLNNWRIIDYNYPYKVNDSYSIYGMPHNEVVLYSPEGISVKYIKFIGVKDKEYKKSLKSLYPCFNWV